MGYPDNMIRTIFPWETIQTTDQWQATDLDSISEETIEDLMSFLQQCSKERYK